MIRLLAQLLFLCTLLLVSGAPAVAAPSPAAAKEELRQLRERIESLQRELTSAQESKSEVADALRASERAISDANRTLRELSVQSQAATDRLGDLQTQTRQGEEKMYRQQRLLGELLYRRYLAGTPEPLRLLLSGESPNRIARELYYYAHISRARADLITRMRENLARLRVLTAEAEQQAANLAAIAAEQALQKRRLEREKRTRSQLLARISRDIQRQRREFGTLKRDENRLTRLIERLGRIMARTPPPRPQPHLRNERLPDRSSETSAFAQLKGRLALPVRGELTNRYGSPRSDGGVVWRGLFIAARAGEAVHAVASGQVVFADWLRGFGNLLILDHGDGYMSLYGCNETLYKQVGQEIKAGETIAAVGNSGGGTDSGLYFELRYQGKPFDPLTWVPSR
ncbi:MAG TPA: peptidoglycan DD-metalloendopeptidase family protein [Burkholderiales bacterium]|nr:peptidoglycan DD-metalloendopeptidase family protein [Burkholderiales bacterium]